MSLKRKEVKTKPGNRGRRGQKFCTAHRTRALRYGTESWPDHSWSTRNERLKFCADLRGSAIAPWVLLASDGGGGGLQWLLTVVWPLTRGNRSAISAFCLFQHNHTHSSSS